MFFMMAFYNLTIICSHVLTALFSLHFYYNEYKCAVNSHGKVGIKYGKIVTYPHDHKLFALKNPFTPAYLLREIGRIV